MLRCCRRWRSALSYSHIRCSRVLDACRCSPRRKLMRLTEGLSERAQRNRSMYENQVSSHSNSPAIGGLYLRPVNRPPVRLSQQHDALKPEAQLAYGAGRVNTTLNGEQARQPTRGLHWRLKRQAYLDRRGGQDLPAPRGYGQTLRAYWPTGQHRGHRTWKCGGR